MIRSVLDARKALVASVSKDDNQEYPYSLMITKVAADAPKPGRIKFADVEFTTPMYLFDNGPEEFDGLQGLLDHCAKDGANISGSDTELLMNVRAPLVSEPTSAEYAARAVRATLVSCSFFLQCVAAHGTCIVLVLEGTRFMVSATNLRMPA